MSDKKVLHFYPGEKRLVYLDGKKVIVDTEAWGGPKNVIKKSYMDAGPTNPGEYVIHQIAPYRTDTWDWSKIKWGTRLKSKPKDVWYHIKNNIWGSVLKDFKITRDDILDRYEALYGKRIVPDKWVFNAFGPLAIRYFKDLNKNKKLDKNEQLEGEMFHTTAENEAEFAQGKTIKMTLSHGCIHLRPAIRPILIKAGAFDQGRQLIIYPYDKKFGK